MVSRGIARDREIAVTLEWRAMKFRPRFSVRTLAIFVTLVCAYFGAWEATKRYGVVDERETSPAPFVVVWTDPGEARIDGRRVATWTPRPARRYLWMYGMRMNMPFESEWTPHEN